MNYLLDQDTSEYRYGPTGTFKQSFINGVVAELEAGVCHRELAAKYGISHKSVRRWGDNYGDASKIPVRKKSFTPVMRRSIARAVIEGSCTKESASNIYGVSIRAIEIWVVAEKKELYATNSIVVNKSEKEQPVGPTASAAENKIKSLEEQLAEANLRIAALNTLIDVAEEQLNINIRKKPGAKQS